MGSPCKGQNHIFQVQTSPKFLPEKNGSIHKKLGSACLFFPLKFLYLVVQGFVSKSEGKEIEIPFLAYSYIKPILPNVEVKTQFTICFSLLERKEQQKNEVGGGG